MLAGRIPTSTFTALQNVRRRRALPAPPAQHCRVEHNPRGRKEVLPGASKYGDNWSLDTHDLSLLLVLLPMAAGWLF
jgi:hypothetical protein